MRKSLLGLEKRILAVVFLFLYVPACDKVADEPLEVTEKDSTGLECPVNDSDVLSDDVIPDFSRVGYKYGDAPIPDSPTVSVISLDKISDALSTKTAADTTAYIQSIIDKVGAEGGGAILLKDGTYNVSRILFIDYDNTVLKGESESGTILMNHGSLQRPCIALGKTVAFTGNETSTSKNICGRRCAISSLLAATSEGSSSYGSVVIKTVKPNGPAIVTGSCSKIDEDYVPVGSLSVKVRTPGIFAKGDYVSIYRPHSNDWVHDIGMDHIASNGREGVSPTIQWTDRDFSLYWSRRVVAVKGDRVYLDAPVVQALDKNYGGGFLYKVRLGRISGSGVENLTVDTAYDPSLKDGKGRFVDEQHVWTAVRVAYSENCWVRNVTSYHMGFGLAMLTDNARCVTVIDCTSHDPVSPVSGGRRYAFEMEKCELCLVKNCKCDNDRHGFATNTANCGPNVFTQCSGTGMTGVMGSHQGWATGNLFDCITTDGGFEVGDRGNTGTGHGWSAANEVLWNIDAGYVACQSPWAPDNTPSLEFSSTHRSGRNYAVGVIGYKTLGKNLNEDYYGNYVTDYYKDVLGFQTRPDGAWYPDAPWDSGNNFWGRADKHVSLPDAEAAAACEWWPILSGESFTNPLSLYECQLEERHKNGIYLNTL